ncbi:oxygen-independent coproporphyrinogen III oxidase [Bauldia litoralis]|uniref:oxygen-independent coproporphyrinogen III oxidase n=1 Tax=Bauldia litoralis TaxID=665467 RepID=UPI003266B3A0
MSQDLSAELERRVPRYTSYPTAPHFAPDVDADVYVNWLRELPKREALSLYLHVPFCAELCLYCGCHTTVARRYAPIADYVDLLQREIELVGRHLDTGRPTTHIHWGGGTPTILSPKHLREVGESIRGRFDIARTAEIAIEIDPRSLDRERVKALAHMGVNRASLGVQDFDETVQRTINRIQTYEHTAQAVEWLREAGIGSINLDLMYGLPYQTVDSVVRSVKTALQLMPARIALFGYAHVPWMKRHQSLLAEESLPDSVERLRQMQAASAVITEAGYVAIGLDHFATRDDALALSWHQGTLKRNFQGYTTDRASTLIGFGTSSIGKLPQGYVQNAAKTVAYRNAITDGRLATVRGLVLTAEDRLRASIIERLMCDLAVDIEQIALAHDADPDDFLPELKSMDVMAREGLITRDGFRITVADEWRALLRNVCAVFDRHLPADATRLSQSV